MNHPRKFLRFVKLIIAFFIFEMLVLAGCAGESVRVEFPINHPANPEAHETEFTLPQNPFQTDVAAMEGETETDSMMKHKTHEESGEQHMNQNMGTKKGSLPDSESPKNPDHRKDDNLHKEHSQ